MDEQREQQLPFENLGSEAFKARLDAAEQDSTKREFAEQDAARQAAAGPLLLDVRTRPEHLSHRIPQSKLLPLQELTARLDELDPERATLIYCEHGVRSVQACLFLASCEFKSLVNLRGGIVAWRGALEGEDVAPLQAQEHELGQPGPDEASNPC